MTTTLLLDIGNSRLKWAIWEGKIDSDQHVLLSHHDHLFNKDLGRLLQIWQNLPVPDHVFGSCVAQEGVKQRIETAIKMRWGNMVYTEWLTALPHCAELRSSYTDPQQLGVDRWLAALSAWKQSQSACLVINIGTAMTVDAVDMNGCFLGGLILPGIEAMRDGLFRRAPALKRFSSTLLEETLPGAISARFSDFPTCTEEAIEVGLWRALSGAILEQHDRLQQHIGTARNMDIWISGGHAQHLLPLLPTTAIAVDDLVLQGAVWQALELHRATASTSSVEAAIGYQQGNDSDRIYVSNLSH
jgi:type III pantothenate kinase